PDLETRLLQATRRQDKAACQRHRTFPAVVEKDVGLLLIKPLSKHGKFNWLVIDTPGECQFGAVISKRQNVCRDPWLDKRAVDDIGRASCRERVEISVVAGSFKKKRMEIRVDIGSD